MNSFFERIKPQRLLLFIFDIAVVNGSFVLSLFLHFGYALPQWVTRYILLRMPLITVVFIGLFLVAKLYNNLWRYMSFYELLSTVFCTGAATVVFLLTRFC